MNYNLKDYDEHGWAHIHHASYRGYVKSIEKFCQADKTQLDYETSDSLHLTPLLVAVLGGRPDAVDSLVRLGAKVDAVDARGHGVIELAALGENVEVLSYFLRNPREGLDVWARLLRLIGCDPLEEELEAVTSCVRELIDPEERFSDVINRKWIVDEGFVPVMVQALRSTASDVVKETVLRILCLLLGIGMGKSEDEEENEEGEDLLGVGRTSAFDCGIVTILIRHMKSTSSGIVRLSSQLLNDLCHTQGYTTDAYDKGAIPALVGAIQQGPGDPATLVEVVEALGTMIGDNPVYQSSLGRINGAVGDLIRLYDRTTDRTLLLSLTSLIVRVVRGHSENQLRFVDGGVGTSLITVLRGRSKDLQGAAVEAVHRLAEENPEAQRRLKECGVVGPLLGTLTKLRQPTIQQTIARALWAIAGEDLRELCEMSHRIGWKQLIEFLTSYSEDLQFIGSEALGILARFSVQSGEQGATQDSPGNHPTKGSPRNQLAQGNPRNQLTQGSPRNQPTQGTPRNQDGQRSHGTFQNAHGTFQNTQRASQSSQGNESAVPPLVRLLGSPQEKIVLSVIRTLRYLCVRPGYVAQPANQTALGQARGLKLLVALMVHASNPLLQAESAFTIACASLGHQDNSDELLQNVDFSCSRVIRMLSSPSSSDEVRLLAGSALAAFAFKNASSQKAIGQEGGLSFSCFLPFLRSTNQLHRCQAAFQVVVLSPVIPDVEAAISSAAGIRLIVDLLQTSNEDSVLSLAADCVARLAHTRVGIAGAFVSIDVISYLCSLIVSGSEHVRSNAVIALGYLSYHHDAKRQILARCRRTPIIMKVLKAMTGNKMSEELLKDWRHFEQIGLPAIETGPTKIVANSNKKRKRRNAHVHSTSSSL